MSLDIAVRTGFCTGSTAEGQRPSFGAVRMKQPSEEVDVAVRNIGYFLKDKWLFDKPDLLAVEAPLPAKAQASNDAAEMALQMIGVVKFVAHAYGVPYKLCNAQTVSRHFTGKSRWSAQEGGRKAKKAAAIQQARVLGYLDPDAKPDDDIADAIALWDYAAAMWGKRQPKVLHMFGERS